MISIQMSGEDNPRTWRMGFNDAFPVYQDEIEDVVSFAVSEEEYYLIWHKIDSMSGLPKFLYPGLTTRWYGDHAKFAAHCFAEMHKHNVLED